MLKKKSFLLVLLLLVFSKELLFLNEELVLFFSFSFLVLVFLQGGVRLVGEYFDGEINAISVRFGDLLRRRLVVVNELLIFRSSQIVIIDMLKQVFLLVLASLPDVVKFSYSIIYTFYNKLFSFFLALQLRTVNEVLLASLSLVSSSFVQARKRALLPTKKFHSLVTFRKRVFGRHKNAAFWMKGSFRSFLSKFNIKRKRKAQKVFNLHIFTRRLVNKSIAGVVKERVGFFSSFFKRAFGIEEKKKTKRKKGRKELNIRRLRRLFLIPSAFYKRRRRKTFWEKTSTKVKKTIKSVLFATGKETGKEKKKGAGKKVN